jgi:flagellar capping protein FliD
MPSVVVTSLTAPTAVYASGRSRAYDGYSFAREGDESSAPIQSILYRNWNPSIRQLRQNVILNDLGTRTVRLTKAIELLTFPDDPSWSNFRVAESSRPDRFLASAADGTTVGRHQVQVDQLAQIQVNTSKALVGAETPSLEAGDYTFDLTINDETISVAVSVNDSGTMADTNKDLLAKIGRQIDMASDDLEVAVLSGKAYDQNNLAVDTNSLAIRSKNLGDGVTFALSDTSGNLVETLGLDRSSPQAGPSRLEYDQQTYTADTNNIFVEDDQILIGLLEHSGSESLTVKQGHQALVDQTADLVNYFNEYVLFLHEKRWDLKPVILNGILNEMDKSLSDIKDIGLAPEGWGRLGMTDRFDQTLLSRPDYVKDVLTGEDGFFTNVEQVLSSILSDNITGFARPISDTSRANTIAAARFAVLEPGLILARMV